MTDSDHRRRRDGGDPALRAGPGRPPRRPADGRREARRARPRARGALRRRRRLQPSTRRPRPTRSRSWSSPRTWPTCWRRSPPPCAPDSCSSRSPRASPPPSSSPACPRVSRSCGSCPTRPALVDEGMAAIAPGSHCDESHLAEAESLMASTGKVLRIPEKQMDAVTAISGSGPAYIFFVVESMIEAGVHLGLPRSTATELVVQTLVGSATMLRETGTHPAVLREQVTSPGGTTASALRELEIHRVRAAFLAAMEAARNRSRELAEGIAEPQRRQRGNVHHMECSGPATVVFDKSLTEYNFGPVPPDVAAARRPDDAAGRGARACSSGCGWSTRRWRPTTQIATVHDEALIEAVTKAGTTPGWSRPLPRPRHRRRPGLRTTCTSRARTSSAPASRPSARCGAASRCTPSTSPAACTTRCPTGPAASASTTTWPWASSSCSTDGAERVAYVDVDVHHGDGVEKIFWDDPRVLTISLHETGQMLFPGTGFPTDSGGGGGRGHGGERRAPARDRRRGLAARLPRRRTSRPARVRPRGAGHPARLRLPHGRPARPPDAQRGRPAGGVHRPPRARPRGRRRPVGGHRRRRLRHRRGGPAGLDAPARDRRRAPARPDDADARRRGGPTSRP